MTGDILSKNSCFEKCFALFFFAADGHVFSTSSSRLSVFLKIWKWRAVYYFRSRSSLKERVISTSTVLNICRTISWQHQVCLILRRVLVHSQRTYHHCIWRSISLVWLSSWSTCSLWVHSIQHSNDLLIRPMSHPAHRVFSSDTPY